MQCILIKCNVHLASSAVFAALDAPRALAALAALADALAQQACVEELRARPSTCAAARHAIALLEVERTSESYRVAARGATSERAARGVGSGDDGVARADIAALHNST